MERLQGPINPCFFGERLEVNCFEQGLIEDEDEEKLLISSLEDKMPFLEMLQSVESQSPQFPPFKDTNFQTLVNIKKPCEEVEEKEKVCIPRRTTEAHFHAPLELESCVTHETAEMPLRSPTKPDNCRGKRRRTRPIKSMEDVENQRMTHITVERNRRRQMNDHLGVLRSIMPSSYIQKGDQASIIGGAIDFVKELEQLLQFLEAQKRMRRNEEIGFSFGTTSCGEESNFGVEVKAENKSEFAEIEVTVIQNHVNLKVQCKRRTGQLVKAIVGLEDLRLTILHLNITSSQASVLYCFNLKIEEGCKLVSASQIAGAVEEIFRFINGS